MYQTNNPIIKHKVGLLNLAEELHNVSKACKIMGDPEILSIAIKNLLTMVGSMP